MTEYTADELRELDAKVFRLLYPDMSARPIVIPRYTTDPAANEALLDFLLSGDCVEIERYDNNLYGQSVKISGSAGKRGLVKRNSRARHSDRKVALVLAALAACEEQK